ncbi:MAG: TerB family tellurite resistance protein [Methyloligellaceae bacterium]
MHNDNVNYPCPYCHDNKLETKATLPYVRGYLIVFQYGYKKIIGCKSCVRKQLLKETGKSTLLGWYSPKALIANPFLIAYGLCRSAMVKTNVKGVLQELENSGIAPPGQEISVLEIGYCLAASMIAADKKIEASEIETALNIGKQIFSDFNETAFRETVAKHKSLPEPTELSAILGEVLEQDAKISICAYLFAIAVADGDFASEEKKLMDTILHNMRVDPNLIYGLKAA